jgi:hypothetical protein
MEFDNTTNSYYERVIDVLLNEAKSKDEVLKLILDEKMPCLMYEIIREHKYDTITDISAYLKLYNELNMIDDAICHLLDGVEELSDLDTQSVIIQILKEYEHTLFNSPDISKNYVELYQSLKFFWLRKVIYLTLSKRD